MVNSIEASILPDLYTLDGCSYKGMSAETVTDLRTELGRSTTFVTKEEYDAYIASLEE